MSRFDPRLLFSGEWAIVQSREVQDIKQAVGGLTACVKQFVVQQQGRARVMVVIIR